MLIRTAKTFLQSLPQLQIYPFHLISELLYFQVKDPGGLFDFMFSSLEQEPDVSCYWKQMFISLKSFD